MRNWTRIREGEYGGFVIRRISDNTFYARPDRGSGGMSLWQSRAKAQKSLESEVRLGRDDYEIVEAHVQLTVPV